MGRVNRNIPPAPPRAGEGVDVRYTSLSELVAEVEKLREPWIADEGPLAASFRQHRGGVLEHPLLPRGLAFDDRTTITWDEDSVQVIRPAAPDPDVLARRSKVLLRKLPSPTASVSPPRSPQGDGRGAGGEGSGRRSLELVYRTDYLSQGVLLASRYTPGDPTDA